MLTNDNGASWWIPSEGECWLEALLQRGIGLYGPSTLVRSEWDCPLHGKETIFDYRPNGQHERRR